MNAPQAKTYNKFKNTKLKLLKTKNRVILARNNLLPDDDIFMSKHVGVF